jgi:SpoVK/Ycf46/Vps4 family AAA+-type ATPase
MVDRVSFNKMNPVFSSFEVHEEDKLLGSPKPDQYYLCASTVVGYSFARRMWGRFLPTGFSELKWRTEAFDYLVLAETKKKLIKSLVEFDRDQLIKDVIPGKGGGCLLILYGAPGTGKTLTAEAVAEKVRKPLMVVSAGELGSQASDIEHKFTTILGTARLWEAIVLLDEADTFLRRRTGNDLFNNAIVSTFLRVLEYHNQVIFLTTNRIEIIDDAVRSRVSVAIEYPDLNRVSRKEVWRKVLQAAKVKIVEVENSGSAEEKKGDIITEHQIGLLARTKINGRLVQLQGKHLD